MNYWGKTKDVLSILVIPLILWGVKMETTLAVQGEKIEELEEEIGEAKSLNSAIQSNSLQLASLTAKLDAANGRLDVIKTLLTH